MFAKFCRAVVCLLACAPLMAVAAPRHQETISGGWRSTLFVSDEQNRTPAADGPFETVGFRDADWKTVQVPHNWQGYSYNRQVVRGTMHGVAWYRKPLTFPKRSADERLFLMFEGVNAYATIWLNGKLVGKHGGGLVSFTLDVTDAVKDGDNLLAVRAENPDGIEDLPWVPGDDQPRNGFAEGSQPLGIFRPVHIIKANSLKVQPFGVYAWGGKANINTERARLTVRNELENLSARPRQFTLVNEMVDAQGRVAGQSTTTRTLKAGEKAQFEQPLSEITRPHLWSPETPYLYTLRTRLIENGKVVDETDTPYGIRTVEIRDNAFGQKQLFINEKPFYIHGTAEYEHHLGGSQAFTPEQVAARVGQVKAGGFNAFRDAHYPHNLRYQEHFARDGLMWWTQFSAHVWFDNPNFRTNFKSLMIDWVKERRNNPALFLWGLQNESKLPADYSREAVAIIREHDPMASVERLIVSCNGGEGTDWNVPQNWSGTYGGNADLYAEELKTQGLVGEYGAWRSLGWHEEAPYANGVFSESAMAALLEKKTRLALSVEGQAVGDFQWLLTTHENPGRPMRIDGTQIFDGIRPLEHIGPSNNKGLLTLWGEPTDAYYMYRAKTIKTPMVHIVSHTWPDRWTEAGVKSGLQVYSNCDAVELFNDVGGKLSLGRRERPADGRPFQWDDVDVRYNVLSAVCLNDNRVQARDLITLNHLPEAPDFATRIQDAAPITRAETGQSYLYRVNTGGADYRDADGQLWLGDRQWAEGRHWGWQSWAEDYPDLDPMLGSRRVSYDVIHGTPEQGLFQTYRFGRDRLNYRFAVPEGEYEIELYFAEPWYGHASIDATGWRIFDVAVNDQVVLDDLDLFAEAGINRAVKKVVRARAINGELRLHFPEVKAGQAVIAAIAIRHAGQGHVTRPDGTDLIAGADNATTFLDNGQAVYADAKARFARLPHLLLDSDYIRPLSATSQGKTTFSLRTEADLYLVLRPEDKAPAGWDVPDFKAQSVSNGTATALIFAKRRATKGETITVPANLPVLARRALPSPFAPGVFTFERNRNLHEGELATLEGGRVATLIKGYAGQAYAEMDSDGYLTWEVTTGLAAKQAYLIRYHVTQPVQAQLKVTDISGITVAEMPLTLTPDAGGNWAEITTETAGFINAGTYRVILSLRSAAAIDYLIAR